MQFGFIERFDLKSSGHENPVSKRELIRGFPDTAGRDDANFAGIDNPVFVELISIDLQDTYAILDRSFTNSPGGK